jgi:hypothetical protein
MGNKGKRAKRAKKKSKLLRVLKNTQSQQYENEGLDNRNVTDLYSESLFKALPGLTHTIDCVDQITLFVVDTLSPDTVDDLDALVVMIFSAYCTWYMEQDVSTSTKPCN